MIYIVRLPKLGGLYLFSPLAVGVFFPCFKRFQILKVGHEGASITFTVYKHVQVHYTLFPIIMAK